MSFYRQWFCNRRGTLRELVLDPYVEEDSVEPTCPLCGATPTSDPKHTISYVEREDHSD